MTRPADWPPRHLSPPMPMEPNGALYTTLGQMLTLHQHSVDLHSRSLMVQEDSRDALLWMPYLIVEELERRRPLSRSLTERIKTLWPAISGIGIVLAVLTGKLGLVEAMSLALR